MLDQHGQPGDNLHVSRTMEGGQRDPFGGCAEKKDSVEINRVRIEILN